MHDVSSPPSRLQPIVNELIDRHPFGDPWIEGLWEMASRTRPGVASKRPGDFGTLVLDEAPSEREARAGKVFERAVAPPAAFLRWLIERPGEMDVRDPGTFGAKSPEVREWRRKLFSSDPAEVSAAQSEGARLLASRLAQRGRNKWWLFEGFARVDVCLVTDSCVLFVEWLDAGTFSSSTPWYPQRRQLWRTVEAAKEFAAGKAYGVVLAVNDEADGIAALAEAEASCDSSLPHLGPDEVEKLSRHLLGFVTLRDLVARFELPSSLLDTP